MFCKACGESVLDTAIICPKCGSATGGVSPVDSKALVTWGWVGAFLLPFVGIILGVVNIVKGKVGHGIGQIVVSLFMWGFWAGFINALSS